MRGMFGLVALLAACGVVILFWTKAQHPADVAKKGMEAQENARQIAGVSFLDSIKVNPVEGNRPYLAVVWLDPAGPAVTQYGFMLNDQIVEIGSMSIDTLGGASIAKDMIVEPTRNPDPSKRGTFVVLRAGQRITLPGGATVGGASTPMNAGGLPPVGPR